MLKFDVKNTTTETIKEMTGTILDPKEILTKALNMLKLARHDIADVARTIEKHNKDLATQISKCKHQIMPEGKMDDWRWNKTFCYRHQDRMLTTSTLTECLEKVNNIWQENKYNDKGQKLYYAVLRLKGAIATANQAIAVMSIAYPVYLETTQPEPITHYSYDPSKPLTEQVLPGFIWKRLSARGITPTNLSENSVYETIPNLWYRMEKNTQGKFQYYNLKSTGKYFERRH